MMDSEFDRNFEDFFQKHPQLVGCKPDLRAAFELLKDAYRRGGKALVCGNGGSASDAEHIVAELMKGFMSPRPVPAAFSERLNALYAEHGAYLGDHLQGALPAIALGSQTALLTAFANDVAADMVFAQQVYGYGRAGDVLIGLSTSGKSRNVLNALLVGRAVGLRTLGLTGENGQELREVCDVLIAVPGSTTPEVQEQHMAIYHALCAWLEAEFFGT